MDDTSDRSEADLTELEERLRRLERENHLLTTILNLVPNQLFWKDRDLVYRGCNQAFADATGMRKPELVVGKTDSEFARDSTHAESYREWDQRIVDTGEARLDIEEPFHDAEGNEGTVITHKIPLRDEGGRVTGVLGICTDITERKLVEAQREVLFHQLESALAEVRFLAEEKSRYFRFVSHDLRNPLHVITGVVSLMAMQVSEPKLLRYLAQMDQAAKSMVALLDRFVKASRIESGQLKPELERIELSELVGACVEQARFLSAAKDQTLSVNLEQAVVDADAECVREVLDNLLSNAVKFSPRGARIWIEMSRQRDQVRIAVIDEGPGLTEEDQARMFRPFTTLTARPTGGETSHGLGLSICRHLVEAMGGRIEAESSGKGATFNVYLPLHD